jgi:tetratricopeptide (TPR) repeat protein
MGIADSRVNAAKITCMSSCAWIALHHGETEHIKEILAKRDRVSEEIGASVGTEEGIAQNAANRLFWASLAAAMEGDYETARSKAEESKAALEILNNPRKLEGYHFAHGYINMKEGSYEEAVAHFEQANLNNQYMKYNLAMALEKTGNTDRAMELLREIDDYNFNGWDYALIRNEVKEKLGTSS